VEEEGKLAAGSLGRLSALLTLVFQTNNEQLLLVIFARNPGCNELWIDVINGSMVNIDEHSSGSFVGCGCNSRDETKTREAYINGTDVE
jgi:hypothetical protein